MEEIWTFGLYNNGTWWLIVGAHFSCVVCVHLSPKRGRVTVNQFKGILRDRFYLSMNHFHPHRSGFCQDDNVSINRAQEGHSVVNTKAAEHLWESKWRNVFPARLFGELEESVQRHTESELHGGPKSFVLYFVTS